MKHFDSGNFKMLQKQDDEGKMCDKIYPAKC